MRSSASVERSADNKDLFASARMSFVVMTDRKSPSDLVSPVTRGHDVWTLKTNQTPSEKLLFTGCCEKIHRVGHRVRPHFGQEQNWTPTSRSVHQMMRLDFQGLQH